MRTQGVRQLIGARGPQLQLVAACAVGVLLGAACTWFSPLWVLAGLAGGGLALVTIKRPEIGLLAILVATSSIVFEDTLPLVPIGFGSLHMPDIVLLGLLGLVAVRWLVDRDFNIIRTPLDWPLLLFYVVALISTFMAVLRSSVEVEAARRTLRIVSYYLTFFVVTNLVREDRQVRLLLRGLVLLATIVAVAMIAQFVVGESVRILPGSVYTLDTAGTVYSGTTRVIPPGHSLIVVSFVAATAAVCFGRSGSTRVLAIIQWVALGLAVALTFLRSYWAALGIAVFLLAFLTRGRERGRLVGLSLLVLLLAAIVLVPAFVEPESRVAALARASFDRLATLGRSETREEESLQWRYAENSYALRTIVSHPLVGLGLGARYRPFDPRLDMEEGWDARRFIHNGHLAILLATGLPGYLCLLWLSFAFLVRGFRYWRCIPDSEMRGIVLSFTLAYLGVLIAAVVNSVFTAWSWTPVLGIMMGVNETVLRSALQENELGGHPHRNQLGSGLTG